MSFDSPGSAGAGDDDGADVRFVETQVQQGVIQLPDQGQWPEAVTCADGVCHTVRRGAIRPSDVQGDIAVFPVNDQVQPVVLDTICLDCPG